MRLLRHLDLSTNKLESVPQNINLLRLDHLNVCDNLLPYANLVTVPVEFSPNAPSLFELAARRVVSQW